jgi:hypothetical protein
MSLSFNPIVLVLVDDRRCACTNVAVCSMPFLNVLLINAVQFLRLHQWSIVYDPDSEPV